MEANENSLVMAAILLGVFIMIAVCIGGSFLIANTAHGKLLSGTVSPRRQLTSCQVSEVLGLLFSEGINGVTTNNSYSGPVEKIVAGKGKSAGSAYTHAFYLFTNNKGSSILPEHLEDWILKINSKLSQYLIPDDRIPTYNDEHINAIEIEGPRGVLFF